MADGRVPLLRLFDDAPAAPAPIDFADELIVDIGMRMLTPRELFNAQGFPPDYIIEPAFNGKKLTKTQQVSKAGNSVCPDLARALVAANYAAPGAAIMAAE